MKLQTKTSYRFLVLLLLVFLMSGVILYIVLGLVMNENLDEILEHKIETVKQNLVKNPTNTSLIVSQDETIKIKPASSSYIPIEYADTSIYDKYEREYVNYRKVKFGVTIHEQFFEATIVLSKLETEDLVGLIFYFMLGLFTFIALLLFFLNRWTSTTLWNPFYKTLNTLNAFKIGHKNSVVFDETNTYEFEQLNSALNKMVQKTQADYNNLKEFTENASHEIQTPLAIIKSKLETVLQDKALASEPYQQIQSAYETISRLSKLNEALLLLTKIENQQFIDVSEIELSGLVTQRLLYIDELINFKKIHVTTSVNQPFIVKINSFLAEILVNNLLGNAVKHNCDGGKIEITSSANQMVFSNTGKPLTILPEKLFHRFVKQNTGNESTGLGLAIAHEICSKSNLELKYDYRDGFHNLIISSNS
jgi:signal transduction histidine kinase